MPLIQTPYVGERLRRAYHLQAPVDPTLSPEVVPVTIVDDLRNIAARAPRACQGKVNNAQVAGGIGYTFFLNPPQGPKVCKVKAISVLSDISGVLTVEFTRLVTGATVFPFGVSFADTGLMGAPAWKLYTGNSFGSTSTNQEFMHAFIRGAGSGNGFFLLELPHPITLYSNQGTYWEGLRLRYQAANTYWEAGVWWEEADEDY